MKRASELAKEAVSSRKTEIISEQSKKMGRGGK
jgi:hypothetical protein